VGSSADRYSRSTLGRWKTILQGLVTACVCMLSFATPALADDWLPHPPNAHWQYQWSDTKYNPGGTLENVTVQSQADASGCGWQLAWTGTDNFAVSPGSPIVYQWPDNGTVCFQDQSVGLVNTNWSGSPPPPSMPVLCASSSQCPNSLGSSMYNVIWGARAPVLSEPLLRGTSWNASGGGSNEVASSNSYLGLQRVSVPAFPHGVTAAAVRSNLALAGTPGDDYGSGIRTTWWVDGVGPVKVVFDHVDGSVTTVALQTTNLKPAAPRPDADYFPLQVGLQGTYEWTNKKHLRQPEIESVSVAAVANRSARIAVKSLSGPIRASGQYGFSLRLDGLRNIWGSASAATLAKFPKLGHGRHFFTPIDLMTYGFNPVLPAYATAGSTWRSGNARDFQVYGVKGSTRILGVHSVRVPAGRFNALEVRSVLTQPGHPFGSGVRTCWFAAGRGLVKMIFQHRDGSTSVVQLLK
jgi:hypothetical protein